MYIKYFGVNNEDRLVGTNNTSTYSTFTHGLDNRTCSVRIPTFPIQKGDISYRMIRGYI